MVIFLFSACNSNEDSGEAEAHPLEIALEGYLDRHDIVQTDWVALDADGTMGILLQVQDLSSFQLLYMHNGEVFSHKLGDMQDVQLLGLGSFGIWLGGGGSSWYFDYIYKLEEGRLVSTHWSYFGANVTGGVAEHNFDGQVVAAEEYHALVSRILERHGLAGGDSGRFLSDLNHFEYVLENNFGLIDVIYWHYGIDLMGTIDELRNEILRAPSDFGEDDFLNLFSASFRFDYSFAHFHVSLPNDDWMANFLPFFEGREELLDEFLRYYQDASCSRTFTQRFFAQHFYEMPPLVEVAIIEDERIGHLAISSFPQHTIQEIPEEDVQKISAFLLETQNFEHIIIDLRGNGGGDFNYFLVNVVQPLINEPIYANAFYFTPHGAYARRFTGGVNGAINLGFSPRAQITPLDRGLRPTAEILYGQDLPSLRIEDLSRLPYGFRAQTRVEPTADSGFNGKIWMLTDGRVGSAAQLAAWFAKESGFATLVGDITGGFYGGPRTNARLPNTGIALTFDMLYPIDAHGRPLEAGTIPHYFNLPGLDALETVLAIIAKP
jgi:hypothetical protein